ncbi:uncharacterized protein [Gorilla gorilla gorilla]|uniref:uncharacterized protein isoform X2 n=1 Tax=Gorilla gorilla gorilla TaxID=9595 RepID=UPI00029DBF60|nr:uncharacterized protein LOC115931941 isoform X2 [Gorilla gorilla gorilla]
MKRSLQVSRRKRQLTTGQAMGKISVFSALIGQVTTPRRPGGLNAAAPKEEAAVLSQEGEQENKKVQKEVAAYPSEASEDSKEQRPWDRVSVPMTELWLDWFSASNTPKTQNREENLSNKSKSCCCYRPGCHLSGPPSSDKPSLASSTLPVPTAAGTALPATEPCDHSGLSLEGPKGALATFLTDSVPGDRPTSLSC